MYTFQLQGVSLLIITEACLESTTVCRKGGVFKKPAKGNNAAT